VSSNLADEEFEFDFDPRYRGMLRLLGVKPSNSMVTLTAGNELRVRFGRWRMKTPVSNVSGTEVTGDYFWAKAIGIRGSLVDRGITFGTNTRRGACLKFHEPVAVVGVRLHPGATLTLVDVEGFLEAVRERLDQGS